MTAEGYRACQEAWMRGHFERLAMIQPILRGLRRPLQPAPAGRSIVVIRRARRVASPHPKRGPER